MPCRLCGIIIIRYYLLADSADAERHELDCDIFELLGVLLVV